MTNFKGVTLINETVYPDGGYVALVSVYGMEYAMHYVAGEVRAYATRQMRSSWKTSKNPRTAEAFTAARIAALGPEFAAAHAALYAEELAAK